MSKYDRLSWVLLIFAAMTLIVSLAFTPSASADGGSIEFDGRVIDLRGASTVTIESQHVTTDWGDVTVTTSIVTVTVWSKP